MRFSATILLSFAAAGLTEHTAHASNRSRVLKKGKAKKDKKSKAPTAEPTEAPAPALSAIELRYGPLASDELMATYEVIPDVEPVLYGMNSLSNVRGMSVLRQLEERNGLGYTLEEFKRVCISACEEHHLCTAAALSSRAGSRGLPNSDSMRCALLDPTLGPLYYDGTIMKVKEECCADDPYWAYKEIMVLYKKGSPVPMDFATIGCDVPEPGLMAPAVNCLFTPPEQQPPECATLLTADYMQFIAPAMMCLTQTAAQAGQDPSGVIGSCLGCLMEKVSLTDPANEWGATQYCQGWMERSCNDDPEIPIAGFFGSKGSCSEVCSASCTDELKTAAVCAGGANIDFSGEGVLGVATGGCIGRGIPGLADFTCPGDGFVAPTPDDWKKVNDDYVNSMAA
eukprot:CAMPEP_0201117720 /NCGR_PEP_ID=MMETSP0850-20130426/1720_1 /ASSEMBLY_ACC=CAM_ASM_000622 /TAXON_ID=183588 /ORGANISM="Pseudo-nitzschia fraudulenta, Strain WWA7" /LENGTH=396 /DNA_ID=CAMNT_0047382269 /DNA_START=55 /DNA_END=1245 /DNA_ORIENTATION=+